MIDFFMMSGEFTGHFVPNAAQKVLQVNIVVDEGSWLMMPPPLEVDMAAFTTRKWILCDPLRSRGDVIYISTSTFKLIVKRYAFPKLFNLSINQIAPHLPLSVLSCSYLTF